MTVIVDTGVANLASVRSAFEALGAPYVISDSTEDVERAKRIVLPGVGAFRSGMDALTSRGLDRVLVDRAQNGVPLLGICLGMQLLCEGSDEAPGIPGLGVIPGFCTRLQGSVRVPQLGWNRVEPDTTNSLIRPGFAAFANSYALKTLNSPWQAARTSYGSEFVSGASLGSVLACQFHPELSGDWGLDLIRRWLDPSIISAAEEQRAWIPGLPIRVIPCLDVQDGRVVKGVNFEGIRDAGDPGDLAEAYALAGADEIVVLDIAASPRSAPTRYDTIRAVRSRCHIPLTAGGGVRTLEDAEAMLNAGADKISVNTSAVHRPELISELSRAFGCQCIVVAIDARRTSEDGRPGKWEVLISGGRKQSGLDATEWAARAEHLGAGEILLTSWDRDGTLAGPDTDLLRAVSENVNIPVVCSGGIGSPADAPTAALAGAGAVLAASIFHDGLYNVSDVKSALRDAGVPCRPTSSTPRSMKHPSRDQK